MDAKRSKWENMIFMWFGWTDPLIVYIIHRCLVGDPTGKSYGDVAFLEQHNLQANILSETFKIKIWHKHTLMLTYCIVCVCYATVCFCLVVLQVWAPLVGQTAGRRQSLSCCVVMVVGPRCQSGRAVTSESSHRTPSWLGQCSRHECTTSSWSHRSVYVLIFFIFFLQ